MLNNSWLKLAGVSLVGIIIGFAVLWGINEFSRYNNNSMNMGYGYQMNGMQMGQQNGKTGYGYDNRMNGMNMQGNMNGMDMMGGMNNMQGNMNGGMGMMGGMGMH